METRFCPKTKQESFCELTDCNYCWHEEGMKAGDIIGGCGSIVRKEDDYVCPYFSRPDEWKKEHGKHGPCGINLQCGTNRCVYALLILHEQSEEENAVS